MLYFSGKKFDLLQVMQGENVPGSVMTSQPRHISLSLSAALSQVNLSYLTLAAEVHRTGPPYNLTGVQCMYG